jgi:Sec-independent protein translocase protein TatA
VAVFDAMPPWPGPGELLFIFMMLVFVFVGEKIPRIADALGKALHGPK